MDGGLLRLFSEPPPGSDPGLGQGSWGFLGPDILMFGSDYPHGESWFPISVETVLAWQLKEEVLRKLLWDNAVRFYRRYSE